MTQQGKRTSTRKRKGRAVTPPETTAPTEDFETRNLLPPYVPPRRKNAPEATIPKNRKIPLIVPLITEGVKVVKYIPPNVKNISYADHDTKLQLDLDHKNHMDIAKDTPEVPQRYVAKEWATQLEQSGILSLLYMPHFGRGTQINICVKQLLLLFHEGVL